MKQTAIILPPTDILLTACTNTPLPSFLSEIDRPKYVPNCVIAIFPAHLQGEGTGSCHHQVLVHFGHDLGEIFAKIADDYQKQIEAEAHDLATLECDQVGA